MAKTSQKAEETSKHEQSLEEKVERLEILGKNILKSDIPLDKALKDFEEGIKLARSVEKELEKIQNRIEVLMNGPNAKATEKVELGLFDAQE